MKKFYLLLSLLVLGFGASAQCVVDTSNLAVGFTPPDSLMPPIVSGQTLDETYTVQVYVPSSIYLQMFNITATIKWIWLSSVTNLPTGLTYSKNPTLDTIYGGNRQCIQLHGATTDGEGVYPLGLNGLLNLNTSFTGDTIIPLALLNLLGGQGGPSFGYTLRVVDAVGVNDLNGQLTKALTVAPNPSNGKFNVMLDYAGSLEGELRVSDLTGRVLFNQKMSSNGYYTTAVDLSAFAHGIYAVQLITDKGVASKIISTE